jgi:hypothetical protein
MSTFEDVTQRRLEQLEDLVAAQAKDIIQLEAAQRNNHTVHGQIEERLQALETGAIELLGKNGRAADERLKKLEFHANLDYIVHAELQSRIEALEGANPRAVPQVKEHL